MEVNKIEKKEIVEELEQQFKNDPSGAYCIHNVKEAYPKEELTSADVGAMFLRLKDRGIIQKDGKGTCPELGRPHTFWEYVGEKDNSVKAECKYCGKMFDTRGLPTHERNCPENPKNKQKQTKSKSQEKNEELEQEKEALVKETKALAKQNWMLKKLLAAEWGL